MKNFLIFANIIISTYCVFNWWLYDPQDHELMFSDRATIEERQFIEDQGKCYGSGSCYLKNSNLNSKGNFENKCCLIKSPLETGCRTVFSGKYFESNLYSLNHAYDNNFTYDCDGEGDKTFNSSLYNPKESWEITNKERYDCIYSETEEECQANPKSFVQNTKCCWFSNAEIYDYASCFGVKEITDDEFDKLIPYISRARLNNPNKTMDFHCYDKYDKIVNGTFDLEFNYIMMQNYQQKMSIEMESEDVLYLFAKKQSFIGIKDYQQDYRYNYFRMYTVSPTGIDKVFTISIRYKYKITSSRNRNLKDNDEEFIEKIVPCTPENIDKNTNLNITLSQCTLNKEEGKDIEKIIVQKGNDLIGYFDEENSEIFEGKQFMKDDDINKIKKAAIFTFKYPTANINTSILEGETTSDMENVKFTIYYSKDSKVQNIQAEGTFLKNSSTVSFVMNPPINLTEGKNIIPSQICKGDNGKYLYIINKVGPIMQNDEIEDSTNNSNESDNILPIKPNKTNLIYNIMIKSINCSIASLFSSKK